MTGSASGMISVGSAETGVSLSGNVTINLTSTGVTVTGKGITVTVGSLPALTGDVTFTRDSTTGVLSFDREHEHRRTERARHRQRHAHRCCLGLSGTLTGGIGPGSITVTFGNGMFTVSASISTSFNDTIGPVSISGTIAGMISSTVPGPSA